MSYASEEVILTVIRQAPPHLRRVPLCARSRYERSTAFSIELCPSELATLNCRVASCPCPRRGHRQNLGWLLLGGASAKVSDFDSTGQ